MGNKSVIEWWDEWADACLYRPGVWRSELLSANPDYEVDYSCLKAPKPWMTREGVYTGFEPIRLKARRVRHRPLAHCPVVQPLHPHMATLPFIVKPFAEDDLPKPRYSSRREEMINGQLHYVYEF